MVERHVANVNVVGSKPTTRSITPPEVSEKVRKAILKVSLRVSRSPERSEGEAKQSHIISCKPLRRLFARGESA